MLAMPRKVLSLAVVVLSLCLVASAYAREAGGATPIQRLIQKSKPAVVRIVDGFVVGIKLRDGRTIPVPLCGTGSGFFISPDGYIMTNAHVVSMSRSSDDTAKNTAVKVLYRQFLKESGRPDSEESRARFLDELAGANVKRVTLVQLADGSTLPYEVKSYGSPIGEGQGKDVAILKVEMKNAATLQLADSSKIKEGDQVYLIGFPAAAESELLDKPLAVEPTTNGGTIASIKTAGAGFPVLQINASATHGNSGGPVLNENGEVIGLLTFRGESVNGQEVQGFNFVIPSNTAREFLRQAGTDNTPGTADRIWKEGLTAYWRGHFKKAKLRFEEVKSLNPFHTEAQRLIADCEERILRGEDTSSGLLVWWSAGGGAVLFAIGAGLLHLRRRRRAALLVGTAAGSAAGAGLAPAGTGAAGVGAPAYRAVEAGELSARRPIQLVFQGGPLAGQKVEVPVRGVWLGREESVNDVVVPHDQVSRQHLWIGVNNGQWVLRDNGSTNGTYVNNIGTGRVTEHILAKDDVIFLARDATAFSVVQ